MADMRRGNLNTLFPGDVLKLVSTPYSLYAKETAMPLEVLETIPVLRIFDVAKAKEFYVGFLGFKVDWEHKFPDVSPVYMQVSLGGLKLHLSEYHGDCCPGAKAFIRVRGLENYHSEIMAKGYGYMRPGIEKSEHRSRYVQVVDPFGNKLQFDETLE